MLWRTREHTGEDRFAKGFQLATRHKPLDDIKQVSGIARSLDDNRIDTLHGTLRNSRIARQHDQRQRWEAGAEVSGDIFPGYLSFEVVIQQGEIDLFMRCDAKTLLSFFDGDHLTPELFQEYLSQLKVLALVVKTKDSRLAVHSGPLLKLDANRKLGS